MAGGQQHVLLSLVITGSLLCGSGAWFVQMPNHIKGMLKSCLVIPCRYGYQQNPPTVPDRVVWYQYAGNSYPLVHDVRNMNAVIPKFKGKTEAGDRGTRECSLRIDPVENSHHREKIYPWVDPEHVGRGTYRFFDTTVTIDVVDKAEPPEISVYGDMKVGQHVTIQCSVVHTCPPNPPTLKFNTKSESSRVAHDSRSDGTARTTLTDSLLIVSVLQMVVCSVRHPGGLEATAAGNLESECSYQPLSIGIGSASDQHRIGPSAEPMFLEGKATVVSCSVEYTCPRHLPTLTWSHKGMPAVSVVTKVGEARWRAVSNLTFTAAANDQGRPLTCIARFEGGRKQEGSMTIQVKRSIMSRDWSYETPGSIAGLTGSCALIPCSFSYSTTQPQGLQVTWYLFQRDAHPQVFPQKQGVVSRYTGGTSAPGSVSQGNCSLYIERLDMSHNQDRLYPWLDRNPITSYHDHNLQDKSSQLVVTDSAQQPQVKIDGVPWVGEEMKVFCRVRHSCPAAPPTLTIDHLLGVDRLSQTEVSHGVWERTIERTWKVREEDEKVACTVRHPGGQTATSDLRMKVECPFEKVQMSALPGELTEGVAKHVTCSVSSNCEKVTQSITWNYRDMQSSITKESEGTTFRTMSNLTFVPGLDDDGKLLTCSAQLTSGATSSASSRLRVKKYEHRVVALDRIDDKSTLLDADVLPKITALTRSCVVVPCTFQPGSDDLRTGLRGIWYNRAGARIYHGGQSRVTDHFKGRTKLLGNVNHGNCTLEIDDIKPFDNGPFCFRAEKGEVKYRFSNSCVFIVMQASPERPLMSPVPNEVDAGSAVIVTCSVNHTCSTHPPVLTWSNHTSAPVVGHTWMGQGLWETSSTVTLTPEAGDGTKALACTATFWGKKAQTTSVQITVTGSLLFQLRSSMPITIPAVAVFLLLAAVTAVCLRRRCKRHRSPPPRPEMRRSVWSRMSRSLVIGGERWIQ